MPSGLSPSQQTFFDDIMEAATRGPLVGAHCRGGTGRTTVLKAVSEELGGTFVRLADVFEKVGAIHPLQLEEGILQAIAEPLLADRAVVVDDLHILSSLFDHCHSAARPKSLGVAFDALLKILEDDDKTLILGLRYRAPQPLHSRCIYAGMPKLSAHDFGHLIGGLLGDRARDFDFDRIHRFVPRLDGHQMRYSALGLREHGALTTDAFIDFLEKHALASNVNTGEVAQVSLDDLHGVDDVIRQLDVDVIVPMERVDVAKELGLRAKRGVLLFGPPGTGKTTVGRALAHRLRNKFFLIDGTVVSGTQGFYQQIFRIFEGAKENAPSILFIDDSDVLFEDSDESGLYRYLLTMLDGLASEDSAEVTIILTAMNIGSLPPALVRSGRVELWLEMTVPPPDARKAILSDQIATCPAYLKTLALDPIVERTDGLTGADLKRVVGDALNLYGYDIAKQNALKSPPEYVSEAIEQLALNKQRLESAPQFTAAHHGSASRRREGYYMASAAMRRVEKEDQ